MRLPRVRASSWRSPPAEGGCAGRLGPGLPLIGSTSPRMRPGPAQGPGGHPAREKLGAAKSLLSASPQAASLLGGSLLPSPTGSLNPRTSWACSSQKPPGLLASRCSAVPRSERPRPCPCLDSSRSTLQVRAVRTSVSALTGSSWGLGTGPVPGTSRGWMRVCGAEAWAGGGLVGPPPPLWPGCHCGATLGPLRGSPAPRRGPSCLQSCRVRPPGHFSLMAEPSLSRWECLCSLSLASLCCPEFIRWAPPTRLAPAPGLTPRAGGKGEAG